MMMTDKELRSHVFTRDDYQEMYSNLNNSNTNIVINALETIKYCSKQASLSESVEVEDETFGLLLETGITQALVQMLNSCFADNQPVEYVKSPFDGINIQFMNPMLNEQIVNTILYIFIEIAASDNNERSEQLVGYGVLNGLSKLLKRHIAVDDICQLCHNILCSGPMLYEQVVFQIEPIIVELMKTPIGYEEGLFNFSIGMISGMEQYDTRTLNYLNYIMQYINSGDEGKVCDILNVLAKLSSFEGFIEHYIRFEDYFKELLQSGNENYIQGVLHCFEKGTVASDQYPMLIYNSGMLPYIVGFVHKLGDVEMDHVPDVDEEEEIENIVISSLFILSNMAAIKNSDIQMKIVDTGVMKDVLYIAINSTDSSLLIESLWVMINISLLLPDSYLMRVALMESFFDAMFMGLNHAGLNKELYKFLLLSLYHILEVGEVNKNDGVNMFYNDCVNANIVYSLLEMKVC